jgi:hypothetical protein
LDYQGGGIFGAESGRVCIRLFLTQWYASGGCGLWGYGLGIGVSSLV